jgi:hypothetical protein
LFSFKPDCYLFLNIVPAVPLVGRSWRGWLLRRRCSFHCHEAKILVIFVLFWDVSQVFDHPSVVAITTYIVTLGLPELTQSTDDSSEEGDGVQHDHISGVTSTALQLVRSPVLGPDAQPAVVGISSMACRTAAGNAVLQLSGVDASQRVPFARWELDRQEQVSAATTRCVQASSSS